FLLAQLHLDSLVGKRSPKAVRAILKTLPSDSSTSKAYDKAYDDAMKRIEDQLTDQAILAKEALMWISCARRLLSPLELQHALGIESESTEFDEENLSEIPDIVSACAGLVTVDEQSNTVRLAHFTTQEYFERTQDQWFPQAALELCVKTLTYLSYDHIVNHVRTVRDSDPPNNATQNDTAKLDPAINKLKKEGTESPNSSLGRSKSQDWKIKNNLTDTDEDYDVKSIIQAYPFCRYASCHWGYHARNVAEMPGIVKEFLSSEKLVRVTERLRYGGGFNPGTTGLHEAAYFGFEEAVEWMLERCSIDSIDSYNVSALEIACGFGHLSLAEMLLKRGANLRGTPITYAARRGQDAIVTYLFQYGASLELGALEAAFRHFKDSTISVEKLPMFQTLLEHGADPNIWIDDWSRPLHQATSDKVEPLVQLLLDHAADVNARDKEGRTALHLAVDAEMEPLEYPLITLDELAHFRSYVSSIWSSRVPPTIATIEDSLNGMEIRMEWEYEPLIYSFLNRMDGKQLHIDKLDESLYDEALEGARPFIQAMKPEANVNIQESQRQSSVYPANMYEASSPLRMHSQQLSPAEFHREMALCLLVDSARLAEMLWEKDAVSKDFDRGRYGELMLAARTGQNYIDQKLHESGVFNATSNASTNKTKTFIIHSTSTRLQELRKKFNIDLGSQSDETSPPGSQPKLIVNLQLVEVDEPSGSAG
ncbi:hypothetical protein IL306_005009, partial [Fusarium sp. DS 682]